MQSSYVLNGMPNQSRFGASIRFQWNALARAESDARDAELAQIVEERVAAARRPVGACLLCGALAAAVFAMFSIVALSVMASFANTSIWGLLNSI